MLASVLWPSLRLHGVAASSVPLRGYIPALSLLDMQVWRLSISPTFAKNNRGAPVAVRTLTCRLLIRVAVVLLMIFLTYL